MCIVHTLCLTYIHRVVAFKEGNSSKKHVIFSPLEGMIIPPGFSNGLLRAGETVVLQMLNYNAHHSWPSIILAGVYGNWSPITSLRQRGDKMGKAGVCSL